MTDALRAGRSTGGESEGGRIRNLLVVVEVALSVVLLVSAGLMARTFLVLQNTDSGINTERVLIVGVPLPPAKYATLEQRNRFADELLTRVRALPGVEGATIGVPLGGRYTPYTIVGQPRDESKRITVGLFTSENLRIFGVALRRGRMYDTTDERRGERVGVINETAAKLWPAGDDPIGARVRLDLLERPPAGWRADTNLPPEVTIIGVMADTRNAGLRVDPQPMVAIPYTVMAPPQRMLAVRASGDPNVLLNPLRAEVRRLDPDQPLGRPITLAEAVGQELTQPRFTMALFAMFAALGLMLAAAGIYSVLSFHVTRRTHELGVRMALGAPRRHVLGLMLTMGGRLVLVGLGIGIAVSLASTRLLRSQLHGVEPADPVSYAAVALILGLVALVACYIPARRAASVEPVTALRAE